MKINKKIKTATKWVPNSIGSGTLKIKIVVYDMISGDFLLFYKINFENAMKKNAHNHLFSPTALMDNMGGVVERYEYNAYGKVQVLTDSDEDNNWFDDEGDTIYAASQYGNPYLFTGRRLDTFSDTGSFEIMYYRNRYYSTYTARFLTQDPAGINPAGGDENPFAIATQYADGMSLYEYVQGRPCNAYDPYGLEPWGIIPIIIAPPTPPGPPPIPWSCVNQLALAQLQKNALLAAMAWTMGPGPASDYFPSPSGGNPFKHCVWNCRMVKNGNNAIWASAVKEAYDGLMADLRDQLIASGCYSFASSSLKKDLEGPACSAEQESDFDDNEIGRGCGGCVDEAEDCEDCCDGSGIGPETNEGPGTDREYGARCMFPELIN